MAKMLIGIGMKKTMNFYFSNKSSHVLIEPDTLAWRSEGEREEIFRFWRERCGGSLNNKGDTDGKPIILLGDEKWNATSLDRAVADVVRVDSWTKERIFRFLFFITNGKIVTFEESEQFRLEKPELPSTTFRRFLDEDLFQPLTEQSDQASDKSSDRLNTESQE
jgi:hypothetical protein